MIAGRSDVDPACAVRTCDRCGDKMPKGAPRRRGEEDDLICGACAQGWPRQTTEALARLIKRVFQEDFSKLAHDEGDPKKISHCPFCGSGQVVRRSDDAIECGYCKNHFTVRAQPVYPGAPQVPELFSPDAPLDLEPAEVPGEVLPGEEPLDGEGVETADSPASTESPDAETEDLLERLRTDSSAHRHGVPPCYVTHRGDVLPEPTYMRYLAASHGGLPCPE